MSRARHLLSSNCCVFGNLIMIKTEILVRCVYSCDLLNNSKHFILSSICFKLSNIYQTWNKQRNLRGGNQPD